MAIKKAVVLAAGFGTRLRPWTWTRPKPLLPVQGEPMLARVLDMLVSWGVTDIAVNAHWLADQVEAFVSDYAKDGTVRVCVSREKEILGTGGALRPLKDWIGDEPFWLVNGDVVMEELDPEPIEAAFAASGNFAACWMSETEGPRTVEADPEGRICNWHSDDPGVSGTYTYCGAALLSPEIIGFLPPEASCSIVAAYEKAMFEAEKFVRGVCEPESYWCDAGTLDTFAALNEGEMPAAAWNEPRLDALCRALGRDPAEMPCAYLGARGSDRIFWRLTATQDAIGVLWEEARAANANAKYAPAARFLDAHGVRVPKVLAERPADRALAMEDLGTDDLETRAKNPKADRIRLYLPVLDLLKRFQNCAAHLDEPGAPVPEPAFDAALYRWETDLFEEHLLRGRYGLDGLPDDARAAYDAIAAELLAGPQTLVHRDFQSSNVLFDAAGRPAMIDFQGMRRGSAYYDYASLLFDPYVPLDEADRKLLAEQAKLPWQAVCRAACQRLAQTLGAFGRLASVGQRQFLRHIPSALHALHAAAHGAEMPAIAELTHHLAEREHVLGAART